MFKRFAPTKKQLAAIRRGLKRQGLKLPAVGRCTVFTRAPGTRLRRDPSPHGAEVCRNPGGGFTVHVLRPRTRRR